MDESHSYGPAPHEPDALLSTASTLWFSAYGFGWGYCAFALPAACENLGAANGTPKQFMLAFELGQHRLLQAVKQNALPITANG
ncbi:hypothetical protein FVF58_21055 [Paraburkholderia panacisoli]|uniref:Uncharacterized protein n=1 Tax=Paraburkholderia panacisoli TaxID=2603818 RepID=A0A5B0H3N3_9BURK|nr:hypothetical protein FVF58_21055 [Paraburkholderia panacisoli]